MKKINLKCKSSYHMHSNNQIKLKVIMLIEYTYSTARFKLHAREYILASANTFSPSSQPILASKGSILASKGRMLSSKGNMLSCMILLAIEVDARVQLVARIRHRAVSRCTRARLHALVHHFTRDLNLMLADITRQAFIKC